MDFAHFLLVVEEVAVVRRASYSGLDMLEGSVAEVWAWNLHAYGVWIEEVVAWTRDRKGLILSLERRLINLFVYFVDEDCYLLHTRQSLLVVA